MLSRFDMDVIKNNKDKIILSFNNFLNTQREDLFTRATNNTTNVEDRYKWGRLLSYELGFIK